MVRGKRDGEPNKPPKRKKAEPTKAGVPGTTPAAEESNVVELPTATRAKASAPQTPGTNALTPEQKRALALRHAEKLKDHKAKVAKATGELRAFLKEAKADGFKKTQLEDIILAQTPEGEAVLKERLELTLQAAKWAGTPFGDLLDHLDKPDLTPAVDRARDEGKMAGIKGETANPPYHTSLPQHQAWLEGWHEGQGELAGGFNKIEPETDPVDADFVEPEGELDPDSDIHSEAAWKNGDPLPDDDGEEPSFA